MRCVQSERGKCGSASPDVPKQEIDLMRPCGAPPYEPWQEQAEREPRMGRSMLPAAAQNLP